MDLKPVSATPLERPAPVVRADALVNVAFERCDVPEMIKFLEDFGFLVSESRGKHHFLRGYGTAPYCVELIESDRDAFVGITFSLANAQDLKILADRHGAAIADRDQPGGGQGISLMSPDGWRVDIVHGFEPIEALPLPVAGVAQNEPGNARRINAPVRNATVPAPVVRLGHIVLATPDFARSARWFMEELGMIPTDVQVLENGVPALAFLRLDRGQEPADHHTIGLVTGPAPGVGHVSTETTGLDAIGEGQQHLMDRGWSHYWGIGRHILGSQIFDYWKDPVGSEWEHYADGDLMTSDYPTGYYAFDLGGLWAWGDDLPSGMGVPPVAVEQAPPELRPLLQALATPPRSWLQH